MTTGTSINDKLGAVLQGRYRILGLLGRGGMGVVYQCEDLRLPGKRWALKEMTVYDPASHEQIEDSFKREAQMLSRLRHRNLPMIVDYFIEESRQYLVMEYIEGENLAQLIGREGQASELQALRWALELAQVLDYLHRQEKPVIFRDLKPDNIIITEDRHIKLVDFGLARQFEPGKRRDTQASGSVGYAPPEQWEDASQTDERSDVYSLGATLFYVLTGRPPSPVYGSQRLRPYRANLDHGAEAIVLRCLQPEPSQRYANTGELIRDLLLWLSKQPTASGTSSQPVRVASEPVVAQLPAAAEVSGTTAAIQISAPAGRHHPLTSPWLLRWLQISTLIFLAVASLGLHQFWGSRAPSGPARDALQKILDASSGEKAQAQALLQKKDYAGAIVLLDKLTTRYPEDAEAHILSQNAYIMLQGKPRYTIPVLTSMGGADREGVQLLPGLAMAQRQINQAGGIRDHQIYLELCDTGSRQDKAIELAGQLSANPDYAVVIGPWTSQQVIATAPIFDAAGLPALAPSASDPRVWEAGRHIFTASESDTHRVERICDFFWKSGYSRVATVTAQDSIVSRSETAEFLDAFTRLSGHPPQQLIYSNTESSFQSQVAALDPSVQAVFMAEYRGETVLHFARALRARFPGLPLATQAVAFSSSVVLEGGQDAEGLLTSTYFHPDAKAERIHEFATQFARSFGTLRPSHREANAYDSLRVVAEAVKQAGWNREAITQYLRDVGSKYPAYPGVSGDFAPGRRLDKRKPYLVQIHDGQYQLMGD